MRYFLTIIFIVINLTSSATGLGDWWEQTPGKNEMGDAGGGVFLTLKKSKQTIEDITQFYFYRTHIVGHSNSGYFIVDETTGEVKQYEQLLDWNRAIEQCNIAPTIWTRWYTDNWKFYSSMFFVIVLITPLTVLALLYFLFRELNNGIMNGGKIKIKSTYILFLLGISVTAIARVLLDCYPQSF